MFGKAGDDDLPVALCLALKRAQHLVANLLQ